MYSTRTVSSSWELRLIGADSEKEKARKALLRKQPCLVEQDKGGCQRFVVEFVHTVHISKIQPSCTCYYCLRLLSIYWYIYWSALVHSTGRRLFYSSAQPTWRHQPERGTHCMDNRIYVHACFNVQVAVQRSFRDVVSMFQAMTLSTRHLCCSVDIIVVLILIR